MVFGVAKRRFQHDLTGFVGKNGITRIKVKIKITGATGYIGKLISEQLIQNGHQVFSISRKLLYGSTDDLKNAISNSDVIINLAGSPILQRWTKKNRTTIYNSRIKTTKNLVAAINRLPKENQPKKFISASAIGIYKPGSPHDENSKNFDSGFLGHVVKDWESALNNLPESIQKNIFRLGMVIGKEAKIIKSLMIPFKLGFGASIGNGEQAFPFIHETDVCNAFIWATEHYNSNGIFNLTAPNTITNKEFTIAFAQTIKRPAFFKIPSFVFNILLGETAVLLLEIPFATPVALQKAEFVFKYPTIESALSEILT